MFIKRRCSGAHRRCSGAHRRCSGAHRPYCGAHWHCCGAPGTLKFWDPTSRKPLFWSPKALFHSPLFCNRKPLSRRKALFQIPLLCKRKPVLWSLKAVFWTRKSRKRPKSLVRTTRNFKVTDPQEKTTHVFSVLENRHGKLKVPGFQRKFLKHALFLLPRNSWSSVKETLKNRGCPRRCIIFVCALYFCFVFP